MTTALSIGAPMEDKARKHAFRAWGYPNEAGEIEFAASCSCGFNAAGFRTEAEAEALATAHYQPGFERPVMEETLYTSRGEEVRVQMSDDAARDALVAKARACDDRGRPNEFVSSLVQAYEKWGRWTDGQRPWAHKLANEQVAPKPEPKVSQEKFTRLVEIMKLAAQGLKRPKITFYAEEGKIQLSIATKAAKIPGSLNVTDGGPYGESTWYGRIHPDSGAFEAGRSNEPWVLNALKALNEDPEAAAREHGQRTGRCCFCNTEIRTNESLAVGYGPICAEHYGLPWG